MGDSNTPDPATLAESRLILFDLDGTIRRARPTVHEAVVALAAESGLHLDEAAQRAGMRWYYHAAAHSQPPEDFEAGTLHPYLSAMGIPDAQAAALAPSIARRLAEGYNPEIVLAEGAKELLWFLRARGHALGLTANWETPLTGEAIELGIIEHVTFTLSAGQAGRRKPDPAFFRAAMALGGAAPDETVAVGDNYYTDFLGARQAGLHAILLDVGGLFPEAEGEGIVIRQLADLRRIFLAEG